MSHPPPRQAPLDGDFEHRQPTRPEHAPPTVAARALPRTDGGGTIEVRQLNPPGPWLALLPPPCAHGHQPAAYIRFADATLIAMAITAAGAAPPGWLTADPEPAPVGDDHPLLPAAE